MTNEIRSLQQK